jgi:hypothetical protein
MKSEAGMLTRFDWLVSHPVRRYRVRMTNENRNLSAIRGTTQAGLR